MLFLFAALVLAAATPDVGPPTVNGVFAQPDVCPGEGCDTTMWWRAKASVPLYKAPGSPRIIGYAKPGDRAAVRETLYWSHPQRGVVLIDAPPFKQGDVIYALIPEGEGYTTVWRRGEQLTLPPDDELDSKGRQVVQWNEAPRPDDIWWVKVRTSHGLTGWLKDPEAFACMGKLAGDENCVDAPQPKGRAAASQP